MLQSNGLRGNISDTNVNITLGGRRGRESFRSGYAYLRSESNASNSRYLPSGILILQDGTGRVERTEIERGNTDENLETLAMFMRSFGFIPIYD